MVPGHEIVGIAKEVGLMRGCMHTNAYFSYPLSVNMYVLSYSKC
jgi:hypothetical protein